jgi:hypothetical protein
MTAPTATNHREAGRRAKITIERHYEPDPDELAEEAGYRDATDLEAGILRANRQRQRSDTLARQIRNLEHEMKEKRATLATRTNPRTADERVPRRAKPTGLDGLLAGLRSWLRG